MHEAAGVGGRAAVHDARGVCSRGYSEDRGVAELSAAPKSPIGRTIMKAITNLLTKVVKDEQGGEVLEYALIAGLIIVAAIAVIGAVGTKVLARWNSLNDGM
jgi:Flp pilus assembly pilin Flp